MKNKMLLSLHHEVAMVVAVTFVHVVKLRPNQEVEVVTMDHQTC